MGQPVYGTSAIRTSGSFGEGIEFVETDTGDAYLSLGGGDWKQIRSSGAPHVYDPYAYKPVTTVTRLAVHASGSTVAAQLATVPVIGAAADLILWDTFGNSPQRVRFRCMISDLDNAASVVMGWMAFINMTQAQVVTELTRICDVNLATGIANYVSGGTIHGNTDQNVIMILPGDDFEHVHSEVITSCVVVDFSRTAAATGDSYLSAQFMPLP